MKKGGRSGRPFFVSRRERPSFARPRDYFEIAPIVFLSRGAA